MIKNNKVSVIGVSRDFSASIKEAYRLSVAAPGAERHGHRPGKISGIVREDWCATTKCHRAWILGVHVVRRVLIGGEDLSGYVKRVGPSQSHSKRRAYAIEDANKIYVASHGVD